MATRKTNGARKAATRKLESDLVDVNLALLSKRRPDLDVSSSHITARIFRLREIFIRELDGTHARFGLKPRMFLVLAALFRSGPPYALPPARLMRYVMWSSGGLSQLLDRMEKVGLLARYDDPNDGRGVLVKLTPEGLRVSDAVLTEHYRIEGRLVAALSKAEHATLSSLLRKLLLAMEGPQLPPVAPRKLGRPRNRMTANGRY